MPTRLQRGRPLVQIIASIVLLAVVVVVVHGLVTPTPVAFLVTSLVVVVIPGTGVVYAVSTAIAAGWTRGGAAAIGCTLGIVPHLMAASLGLSGLLQANAEAFEAVRWIGVAYLAFLGIGMIRSAGSLGDLDHDQASTVTATIGRGVALNLLNPKLTVFFFAFLPQFLATPPAVLDPRLLGLSGVFMAMTLSVFLVYVAVAAGVRQKILSTPAVLRRIEQSLGVVLLGFAARLAVADR